MIARNPLSLFIPLTFLHCSAWQGSPGEGEVELKDPLMYYGQTHPGADFGIEIDGLTLWPAEPIRQRLDSITGGKLNNEESVTSDEAQETNPWLNPEFLALQLEALESEGLTSHHSPAAPGVNPENFPSNGAKPIANTPDNEGQDSTASTPPDEPALFLGEPRLIVYKEGLGSQKRLWFENSAAGNSPLCRVVVYSNGNLTPYRSYDFLRHLAPSERFGLCTESEKVSRPEGCDQLMSTSFNGDDALELWCNDLLYDQFGLVGQDPGESWQWTYQELTSAATGDTGIGGQGSIDAEASSSAAAGNAGSEEQATINSTEEFDRGVSKTASSKDSWLMRCPEPTAPYSQLMGGWFEWQPPETNAPGTLESAYINNLERCQDLSF